MTVRNVRKNLAAQQDMLPGVGPYNQTRRGVAVVVDGPAKSFINLWVRTLQDASIDYAGTFEDGCTVPVGDAAVCLLRGKAYINQGASTVVLNAGSDPASTGGIVPSGIWLEVTTQSLKANLLLNTAASTIFTASGESVQAELDKIEDYYKSFVTPEQFGGIPGTSGVDNSSAVQSAINDAVKVALLRDKFEVSSQVSMASLKTLEGQGNSTGLEWTGGNGDGTEAVLRVAAANPATNALNGVTVHDLIIDMSNAENLIGVNMLYASVQSMLDGIQVTQMGAGSTAFRIGKEWYARLERCSVRNAVRLGTAVFVDTGVGQVNSVPLDVQINGADIGFDIDTSSGYVYGLDIPRTAHAENCNIGLKVRSGQGVRQGVISGYFENNGIDVEWGDADATPSDLTQNIIWLGASFNPNGSRVVLYEGRHYFYGCDRIHTIEVHGNASAEIVGGVVNNLINTTGDTNRLRYRPSPTDALSTSIYGNRSLLPGREMVYGTTTSAESASFDFVSAVFGTKPVNGRSCRITACSRRTYENTVRFFECIVSQNAAGAWGITTLSGSAEGSLSIAIDSSTGVITVGDPRGDSKVYLLSVRPF